MEETQLLPWVLSGVASIVGAMASAIAFVYHGRIRDLRETIKSEREENRALMDRLFQEQVSTTATTASVAAVAAAASAAAPSVVTISSPNPGE